MPGDSQRGAGRSEARETTEGHKGGTGRHAHPHPCSGAVACREALRGVLGGAKPVKARAEPTGAQEDQGDDQGTSGCVNMSHTIMVIIRVAQVSMKGLFLNRLYISKRR